MKNPTGEEVNIEKCVDEVRRGMEEYHEYKYCGKFLDAMTENAEAIVVGLGQRVKDLEEVKKVILDYVYCACTGLENAEGHPETIMYPRIAYTIGGVLAVLGVKE